jgi:SPP1 family predicted phage head-tail adaptor
MTMPVLFFDPGQMTARLELQSASAVPDGQGGVTQSWVTLASLWARIEPVSMMPEEIAGQQRGTQSHRIWIRKRDDIAEGMRFVKGARVFDIQALRDPDESGRYLVCLCEEFGL